MNFFFRVGGQYDGHLGRVKGIDMIEVNKLVGCLREAWAEFFIGVPAFAHMSRTVAG